MHFIPIAFRASLTSNVGFGIVMIGEDKIEGYKGCESGAVLRPFLVGHREEVAPSAQLRGAVALLADGGGAALLGPGVRVKAAPAEPPHICEFKGVT